MSGNIIFVSLLATIFVALAGNVKCITPIPYYANTPYSLQLLQNGDVDPKIFTHVLVLAPAHPDILSLATIPFHHEYLQATFIDADGNQIHTYPVDKDTTVVAAFRNGTNLTAYLPKIFRHYSLTYGPNVTIKPVDIEHISKLQYVIKLHINCPQDLVHELSQQDGELLGKISALRFLHFNLPSSSYAKIDIRRFTDNMANLEQISIDTHGLTASQVDKFVNNQGKIDNWRVKVVNGLIQFIKIRLNP